MNLIELTVIIGPAVCQPVADGFNPENCSCRQVFFGLFFLIVTAVYMIRISSSRTGKARWTPVAIGNLPSSKSTETLWWRNRSGSAMSSDAGPLESAVAAPAVESFSNFAPDSGLSPFLTLEKNYKTPNRSLEFS